MIFNKYQIHINNKYENYIQILHFKLESFISSLISFAELTIDNIERCLQLLTSKSISIKKQKYSPIINYSLFKNLEIAKWF